MRFSTTALLALPLLASAAESPFEQYKAKFQNFLSSFGASAPADKAADAASAASSAAAAATGRGGSAKTKKVVEPKKISVLTLDNWKDTLYGPVQGPGHEDWLVLMTGRNKTCFGRCERLEAAFTDSALKFASLPPSQPSPHLAKVNCDDTPVLCNSWSASAGGFWLWSVPPPPAPVDIHTKGLNLTTVTAQDIVDAYGVYAAASNKTEAGWRHVDPKGYFHPTEGRFAKWGVAVPLGYLFWALNVLPSWAMMLILSFVSRTMMNRRMNNQNRPAAPGAAPRAAPAGDARS